ncbi:helix-turn-helix domain-containing protein [Xenorhabdus cabanillasii]|uniref:Transcriptional regulator n=1 Tax=Xenorhabdus cabanillasii JM26 TaxID=1427517 RepID=W1J213_9GAMM|nr:helix-turn-helix transcriptional regulator [Xenorhabdus cabanillasii]PHM78472.1 transcriptional regulator [Xenorhabdus cabanillasii JM26]CDL83475.1 putative transcriptional regulator [Xenorhabdus cabanillasii JM26]
MKTLKKKIREFSKEDQAEIKQMADGLVLETGLQQLRQELNISQQKLADSLGISQPAITQIEQRGNDIKLVTLKRYVEAMGSKLSLTVELPTGNGKIFHI